MTSMSARPQRRWRVTARHVIAGLMVALAALFIVQNGDSTAINILNVTVKAPLWTVLLVLFAAGVVTGMLINSRRTSS